MTLKHSDPDRRRRAAEEELRRKHLTVTLAVTLLAVLAYVVTVILTSGRLPGSLATHFAVDGRPDDFMRTAPALLFQGAVVVFMPVALLVSFGLLHWWRGEFARSMSALIAGICVALSTLFVVLTAAHVPVADPAEVRLTWQMGLIVVAAGGVAAALAFLLLPAPLPRPEPQPVIPVEIAPSYRVSWFGKVRMSQAFVITLATATVLLAASAIASNVWWTWLVVILMLVLLATLSSFDVVVDSQGVRWRSALGWPRGSVPLSRITDVSVIEVTPGDFGGYGVRLLPGRLGLISRHGRALRIAHGDRELVMTLDDAEVAAGVLEGWRAKARGRGA